LLSVPALILALMAITGCGQRTPAPPADSPEAASRAVPSGERVVNVYNWADYIDPEVIADFEKTSGIKVNYDTFDSQEMLETKLLASKSGYDVVVVASDKLARLGPIGVFRKLDYSRLPSSKNLDPALHAALATFDPGNEHAVGYLWGTTGIGYDARKLQALAPDAPTDSWRLAFDAKEVAAMAGCGVSIVDAPSEVIAVALIAQGRDPNAISAESVAEAKKLLLGIRPSVRKIDSDSQIEDLANESVCLMVTYATNVGQARTRARDAGRDVDFRYVIPREGALQWFDTLAIPADAPHPDEAHAFIDFLMRADVAARNANYVGQATVNAAAMPMIDEALRNDPSIYPPAEVLARLFPLRARTQEESRLENSAWTSFRGGQ
jgi:putrescine transport system substrate-binding protein